MAYDVKILQINILIIGGKVNLNVSYICRLSRLLVLFVVGENLFFNSGPIEFKPDINTKTGKEIKLGNFIILNNKSVGPF